MEQLNQVTTVKAAKVVPVLKWMFDKQTVKASARNVLKATDATRKFLRVSADRNAVIGDERFAISIEFLASDDRLARF